MRKEVLMKGLNEKSNLRKKNKSKILAMFLASGVLTYSLGTEVVSAYTIDSFNTENTSSGQADPYPTVEWQKLYFNKDIPRDIVVENVDFKGTTLAGFSIGQENIDISKIQTTNNSIIIPKEVLMGLNLENGSYVTGIKFSNGTEFIGRVTIDIDSKNTASKPTIKKQSLSFDRSNYQDVVIENVDFKEQNLKSISIAGKHIDISKVKTTENSIIIPKESLINAPIKNGWYYVTIVFDNSASFADVTINITGDSNPIVKEETLYFYKDNPQDVVINVDFKGLGLKYIYINGNAISASSLNIEENKVIIPADVLKSLNLLEGAYEISFKFLNDSNLLSAVYLKVIETSTEEKPEVVPPVEENPEVNPPVEEKPEVNPPVEENHEVNSPVEDTTVVDIDNGEEILFDISKPTNIKILSSKLENKEVEYILVNGIKVTRTTIEGKLIRNAYTYAAKEYFTTSSGYIVLSANLFEDLNLDVKDGYNIGVGFADGSEITDLAKLSIMDSSNEQENTVTPPTANNENNSNNNGNTSNVGSNSTTNKVEETNNKEDNKLPNTGSPIGSGIVSLFGALSVFGGTRLLKKKK